MAIKGHHLVDEIYVITFGDWELAQLSHKFLPELLQVKYNWIFRHDSLSNHGFHEKDCKILFHGSRKRNAFFTPASIYSEIGTSMSQGIWG